ncbi:hypothetical protein Taro_023868 [Colocasia esculenta]|uniref:Uncharacterized protein n=1 Tax=Colocasia esculenta TaxID=4460 RepID=A0A843V7N4_COLES|nr:hypothetical protein [Colocasia esculenta]
MWKQPSARTYRDNEAHGTPERPRETRISRHKHQHPGPPQGTPRETAERKPLSMAHEAKPTKPKEARYG